MEKIEASLGMAQKLQRIILWYLSVLALTFLLTWILPDKGLMLQISVPIFWVFLLVLPFAIFTLIFTSGVFVRMAQVNPNLKSLAQVASVVTLISVAYLLIYLVWGSQILEIARQSDHNLVMILDFSPVGVGLLLLATHVLVVRSASAKLKFSATA